MTACSEGRRGIAAHLVDGSETNEVKSAFEAKRRAGTAPAEIDLLRRSILF